MTQIAAKTTPVDGMAEIDFNSPEFQANFKEIYAEMHASGCPFAHSSRGDHYAIGSHEVLTKSLMQPKLWRSKYGPGLPYQPEDTPGVLVTVDPPEHTFEAKIAGRAFSKAYFDSFDQPITDFINEQIDRVYQDGKCDLHALLSTPLPLFVIFRMFGISLDGRDELFRRELKGAVGFMTMPLDLRGDIRQDDYVTETQKMIVEHFLKCKAGIEDGTMSREDNLVTRFLTTRIDGERLSDEKIMGFCSFLLTAGSATTTVLLSNVLYRLLENPEHMAMLREDPSLIPQAIEEALRIDAPVQGLFRTNDEPVELAGATLEPDTKVMMLWAAANLDPAVFPDPLKFDITRDPKQLRKHVAFGHGIHICRGAPLARMEGKIFLEIVLRRFKNLRIDGEVKPELAMPILQGIAEFPVAWDVD